MPYVDFENKSFIFDEETEKYQKQNSGENSLTPEIWHGFISPNT